METIQYGKIGEEDIKTGRSTFEVTLGDGRIATLNEVNLDSFDKLLSEEDSTANDVGVVLTLRKTTTGTPASALGTGLKFQAESSDEDPSDVGQLEFAFDDVSAGSEDSTFWAKLRAGGAALARAFGFRNIGAASGYFLLSGTATGNRTLTLPDASDTLVGKATTDTLTNKTLTDALHNAGTGTETFYASGVINVDSTEAACSGSSETDLISYTLPANSLSANGKGVRVRVAGITAANSNTKTIRLYFGASVVISNDITTTPNNKSWEFEATIWRDSASTQEHLSRGSVGSVLQTTAYGGLSATMTSTITIKVTGQGAATTDITGKFLTVEFLNG